MTVSELFGIRNAEGQDGGGGLAGDTLMYVGRSAPMQKPRVFIKEHLKRKIV